MKNSRWINFFCLLLLTSCYPVRPGGLHRTGEDRPPAGSIVPSDSTVHRPHTADPFADFLKGLFKASMTIRDHKLTGLMMIKRMDSVSPAAAPAKEPDYSYRIVFASEIGLTFFDLELSPAGMKVISCFESLNRKNLLKILESDFRTLLGLNHLAAVAVKSYRQEPGNAMVPFRKSGTRKIWEIYNPSGDTLIGINGKSNPVNGLMISLLDYKKTFPGEIIIRNPLIGMEMNLRLLSH
jgi:hypothetical protein